jgi:hypothetical protein
MTTIGIGVVLLVLAGIFHWRDVWPKAQVYMAFIGVCLAAAGAWEHWLVKGITFANKGTGTISEKLFGQAVPGLLFAILAAIVLIDVFKKKKATRSTFLCSIALAACLVAGLSPFKSANNVPANLRGGVQSNVTNGK